jgi:hypothetical protein
MAAAQPAPELISLPGLEHVEDETLARRYRCPPQPLLQELLQSECLLTAAQGGTPDLSSATPCAWEWIEEINITDQGATRSGRPSKFSSHEGARRCLTYEPSRAAHRALERVSERRWKYSTLSAHELCDAASRHYDSLLHKQQRENECYDEMFRDHLRRNYKDKLGSGPALTATLAAVAPSLELAAVPSPAAEVALASSMAHPTILGLRHRALRKSNAISQ